ncbi:DNA repair protein [Marinobacter lutaoensis]|uniref:DNA repair protein n=1 Tax=Marinobacter lutaoensis TaxID=135739 RepID=A0A1V2DTX9_9GAMM|nr:DNA polymerase Y family protein [Marinobacter lutaoensis]ONF43910.1 DNA repair protein [Marinobacter lutaoensis]
MLWLYLHFPHMLLDHLRRHRQSSRPLAILSGQDPRVAQACPEARALGITAGMRLKTALALAPNLDVIQTQPGQDTQVLEAQARWLYRCAAHIALRPPDGLLAEVASLQRLYGGLPGVWQTVAQALETHQLTASMALGHTPEAARLLARADQGECTADTARIRHRVTGLPLSQAGFDRTTTERLQRLGLTRLGEVLALPPAELARRLSPDALSHLQKIQGTRPDPVQPWHPPHVFRQEVDFLQDIEQSQGLLFPLQRVLSELEEELRWRQQDTDSLHLSLRHRQGDDSRIHLRTAGPEHRAEAFLNLARLHLERHPLSAPVTGLRVCVRRFLARDASRGQDLFGKHSHPEEAWHTLASRLQARLGASALQRLVPRADHRPERAWAAAGALGEPHQQRPVPVLPGHRPLWLLASPYPLGEAPAAWLSGPERIRSGWWDGQPVQRDYYVVQLADGPLAWVFRDLRNDWFIHGWFG